MNENNYVKTTSESGVITFTPKRKQYSLKDVVAGMKSSYSKNCMVFRYISYQGNYLVVGEPSPFQAMDLPITAARIVERLNEGSVLLVD